MRHIRTGFAGALLALLLVPAFGRADGSLGDALTQLANDIKKVCESEGKLRLTVGQFAGRGDMARYSSSGPVIQIELGNLLKRIGLVIVEKKADFEVTGDYTEMEDTNTGRQFVLIKAELTDRQGIAKHLQGIQNVDGKPQVTKYFVKKEPDLSKILGLTVQPPTTGGEKARIDAYKKAVDDPKVTLGGTRIFAAPGSPFSLEILTAYQKPGGHVERDYQAQRPTDKGGLAFVPIARDYVYGVRIYNDSDYSVAAHLCIDGLSMFHASTIRDKKTGGPAYKYIILPPKSSYLVRGWFIDLKNTDEFLVAEYAKSEAGKIGQTANLGTINVTYHAAWDKKNGHPPADEPKNPDEYAHSASDATARGDRITQNYQVVDYQTGVPRATISVRYTK